MITITLLGEPQPYRERARVHQGRVWSSRTAGLQRYQGWLRNAAQQAMEGQQKLHGPVFLTLRAYMPMPKTMLKRDRLLAEQELLPHAKRPDMAQILKAAEDACNQVVWSDDAQVARYALLKLYSPRPRLEMVVEPYVPMPLAGTVRARPELGRDLFAIEGVQSS